MPDPKATPLAAQLLGSAVTEATPENPGSSVITPSMVQQEEIKQKQQKPLVHTPPVVKKEPSEPARKENQEAPEKGPMAELRKAHKTQLDRADALEKQLSEFEGTKKERDELKEKYESAQSDIAKARKIESVAALEQDEDFQSKYVAGKDKLIASLKDIASTGNIEEGEIFKAMQIADKKSRIEAINNIYTQLPEYLRDDLRTALKGIEKLDADRANELSHAEDVLAKRLEDNRSKKRQKTESESAESKAAWDEVASQAKDMGLTDDQVMEAKEFYFKNKDRKKAALTVMEARRVKVLEAKLAEAQEEIGRYKGASPGIRAGGAKEKSGEAKPVSMFQAITGRTPSLHGV